MNLRRQLSKNRAIRRAVGQNVTVGDGFTVGASSVLWAPQSLLVGRHVHVGSLVRIEVDGVIGDNVLIANSTAIVGRTDHAMREVGVPITETTWVGNLPDLLSRPVHIGSDTWIGFGAVILSGVTIGDSSIIGAGSVVVNDIPANSIATGNPASVRGARFSEGDLKEHWSMLRSLGVRVGQQCTEK